MGVTVEQFEGMEAVPYSEARDQIRNGDILLFSGSEAFSRIIQHFTNSHWSHVGFIWRMDDIDRLMLLESVEHVGPHRVDELESERRRVHDPL